MSDIAQLGFNVNTKGLTSGERALDKFAATGSKTESKTLASSKKMSASFKLLAGTIGSVAAAFTSLQKLVEVTREFDVLNAQLITAVGSAENAAKAFEGIQKFAEKTPFDLAQTTEAFTKLVGLGLDPSEKALISLGNTAAAKGKPLMQLIEAVADAATGEFERLKEFDIKSKQQGDNVAFTFRGITTVVKKEAESIQKFLTDLGDNEFAGAMALRMDTLDGKISNLGDSWDKLFLNISKAGVGDLIEDGVVVAISALEDMNDFVESGQLAASIELLGIKFGGFADDVENAITDVVNLFSAGSALWTQEIDDFLELSKGAFLDFPENVRAMIQLVGVELAALVTFAEVFGTAFGQVLGIKLAELDEKAAVFGLALADSLNPFSDGSFDLASELEMLTSLSIGMTNDILANAEESAEITTQLRRDAIMDVINERDAAVESSDAQIDKIIALGVEFDNLKKKRSEATGDALAQFKITNKEADKGQKITSKQAREFEKLTKKVDNFGGSWSKTGSIIVDTFGNMADALNDYMDRVEDIGKLEKEVADARVVYGADNAEVTRLQEKLNSERIGAELSGMKSIASATGALFDEKTAAAKAFAALTQILTVAEIALSFQKMTASTTEAGVHVANETTKQGANALTAITSAFAAPFPVNFVAGAAMIGIMASLLGGAFGGGGGGAVDPTESIQDSQGTGTVFGSDDKSASILESQERFEDLAIDQLAELRGIRDSINSLAGGIAQLANSIVAGGGVGAFGGALEDSNFTDTAIGGLMNSTGMDPTGVIGAILGAFSSTKKSVIDEGINFIGQSLGSIIDEGIIQAQAFFTIKTKKKKFFGLSSSTSQKDEFQELDAALNEQIANIFGHIGDTVLQSAKLLGFETVEITKLGFEDLGFEEMSLATSGALVKWVEAITGDTSETVTLSLEEALKEFQVDIGKISLEGLSGEEIQQELEAVFSQQADLIAEFLVPSMADYQKIGEGLFDTLTRVAKEQVIFNSSIERMGFDLSGLSNIIQIDIAQSLIDLTGGVDKFADASSSFFENFFSDAEQFAFLEQSLSSVFDSLGLSLVTSREEFKSLIEGIDITTEEGQALLAALLEINPALSDYIDELERVESKRVDMSIELLRLQGFAEEALAAERELELAAMDESLRALQLLIFAEEDRIALLKEQENAVRSSFSMLERAIELERQRAQAVLDVATEAHESELDRIDQLRLELNAEKALRSSNLADAETALNKAFDSEMKRIQEGANAEISAIQESSSAEMSAIQSNSSARISALNDEKSALNATASSMRSLVKSVNSSLGLDGGKDLISALAEARAGDFTKALNLDVSGLSSLDPSQFTSAQDLAVQEAINQNRLKDISDLAGEQLTEAEAALAAIDRQIEQVKSSSDLQIESIKASSKSQIEAIQEQADLQLSELQEQLNTLLGIDTSVLSVADAINQFKEAQQALDELNYDKELAKLDMLVESANDVFALHEQAYADEMERLDKILEDNEALLNAALGIDASVLSVADAITALNASIAELADLNPQPIPDEPFTQNSQNSAQASIQAEETKEEIKKMREDNIMFQRELIKNTKTTANILKRFELDGLDTRTIN